GQGVPQDYTQAYMWINLAAAKEIANAGETRDKLVKKLTPSQIEEGQRLAREWIAKHPQTGQ
ncbi:MAG: sel1 repeat family protein, partial [Methylococcales bacterium]|nr:sel1 repeat family protein [Methylococcales bacterium]